MSPLDRVPPLVAPHGPPPRRRVAPAGTARARWLPGACSHCRCNAMTPTSGALCCFCARPADDAAAAGAGSLCELTGGFGGQQHYHEACAAYSSIAYGRVAGPGLPRVPWRAGEIPQHKVSNQRNSHARGVGLNWCRPNTTTPLLCRSSTRPHEPFVLCVRCVACVEPRWAAAAQAVPTRGTCRAPGARRKQAVTWSFQPAPLRQPASSMRAGALSSWHGCRRAHARAVPCSW